MTSQEQEALSHQHSHGLWLVPLEAGSFAIFDHPNGKLLTTVEKVEGLKKMVSNTSAKT